MPLYNVYLVDGTNKRYPTFVGAFDCARSYAARTQARDMHNPDGSTMDYFAVLAADDKGEKR